MNYKQKVSESLSGSFGVVRKAGTVAVAAWAVLGTGIASAQARGARDPFSIFGYGGGGQLPPPIPPRVSELLFNLPGGISNLITHIFSTGLFGGFHF